MKQNDVNSLRIRLAERIVFFCNEIVHMRETYAKDYTIFCNLNFAQYTYVVCITQIGELANRFDDEFTADHPDIPWKDIISMRNFLVHEYHRVQTDILWDTGENDIPYIRSRFADLLTGLSQDK